MKKYRAIRKPYENVWHVECFDTENYVAYFLNIEPFYNKESAQQFIYDAYFTGYTGNRTDGGEVGEWINGSI